MELNIHRVQAIVLSEVREIGTGTIVRNLQVVAAGGEDFELSLFADKRTSLAVFDGGDFWGSRALAFKRAAEVAAAAKAAKEAA